MTFIFDHVALKSSPQARQNTINRTLKNGKNNDVFSTLS